ncbi:MAG: class I tRNA ligase family protein [Patescibacteria group bacterium]
MKNPEPTNRSCGAGMPEKMQSRYDHTTAEPETYKQWEESGAFNPDKLPDAKGREPYTIIMPPPNANGHLHAGHAMFVTIEDIMTRYARMRGKAALWLPGADHAGFETQVVYEKKLEREGRTRFEMTREELYKEIMTFTLENKSHMESELRSLGASCDWSREKFTLDPAVIKTVYKTFKKLYDDGLAYRGKRIVSWCPKHQTSFSDLEIADVERVDPFYYLQYGPFVIGTSRPETKFGDKYVVMHPSDPRYASYADGQKIELEWINGPITATVVKDEAIDMEFGTGAMTITPWHDAVDFGIAERHELDREQIIDERGRLLPIAGEFAGMKIAEAREKIIAKLKGKGLLVKVDEKYNHVVRTCYKCGTTIEPQIKDQWFVKTKPLAERALQAIEKKEVSFIPERYETICRQWLENIIDWNISRQIAWGIRIPAWFCVRCGEAKVEPEIKAKWFIVRHGETDSNKSKRLVGHGDVPLNDEGRAQARAAGKKLKSEKIDLIVSSDLGRCRETAAIIAEEIGAEVAYDPAFRERNHGNLEGQLREDLEAKHGNLYRYDERVTDDETHKEVEDRVWVAFQKHRSAHGGKNVILVSHGGVIRMLVKQIRNLTPEDALTRPSVKNAEVLSVDVGPTCPTCEGDLYEQDTDTFDTWFSSGQWPFITLGYPDGKDFKKRYPTDVMETAGEIIFFWVTRMIMLGLYVTGEVPFRNVYLHGLVLDAKGQKMSKSKGNVISPLEITTKYGTDALRMALVVGNTPGTSLALAEDRVRGYRNFTTKIWNAARFVYMNRQGGSMSGTPSADDEKNLDELRTVKAEITGHIERSEFHLAAEKAYHYFWHTFADKLIEAAKPRLQGDKTEEKAAAQATLEKLLLESMKMLHPFMPFVTEAVWQKFRPGTMLMIEPW